MFPDQFKVTGTAAALQESEDLSQQYCSNIALPIEQTVEKDLAITCFPHCSFLFALPDRSLSLALNTKLSLNAAQLKSSKLLNLPDLSIKVFYTSLLNERIANISTHKETSANMMFPRYGTRHSKGFC